MNNKKREASLLLFFTAGDWDRTFLRPANIDGKESDGLAYYFEPSSEPTFKYSIFMYNCHRLII